MLCGEIGLTIKQFDALTWRQLDNIVKGYFKKVEREQKQSWQQIRMLMHSMLIPHAKKGSQLTPEKVLPFPWDNEVDVKEVEQSATAEDVKKSIAFWDKVDENKTRGLEEK